MGPAQQYSGNGVRAPQAEDDRTPAVGGTKPDQGLTTPSATSPTSRPESRSSERLTRLLSQNKGPDAAIVAVLSAALVFGLLGFALHLLWFVAIIVMTLGLGFTLANSRRNRIDVVNQRAERRSDAENRRSESDTTHHA
jgi:hypothetical protein